MRARKYETNRDSEKCQLSTTVVKVIDEKSVGIFTETVDISMKESYISIEVINWIIFSLLFLYRMYSANIQIDNWIIFFDTGSKFPLPSRVCLKKIIQNLYRNLFLNKTGRTSPHKILEHHKLTNNIRWFFLNKFFTLLPVCAGVFIKSKNILKSGSYYEKKNYTGSLTLVKHYFS